MERGIYGAASGMMLETKRQEAIAQNLAGSSIPGFKRQFLITSSFSNELAGEMGGSSKSAGKSQTRYDFSQGTLQKTDRTLDFAFNTYLQNPSDPSLKNGELFFQVKDPNGNVLLTKNGVFRVNADKEIVTTEGYKLVGDGGSAITLGADDNISDLTVTSDGLLKINDKTTSPSTLKSLGTIQLALVKDPQSLTRYTANYFGDPNNIAGVSPAPTETFNMLNGYHEDSNSSPIHEINAMIQSMREFEFHSKIVKSVQDLYRAEQSRLT